MSKEFYQSEWDAQVEDDCRQLVRLAIREDLDRLLDWTTVCIVRSQAAAEANVVARQSGVVCGLRAAALVTAAMDDRLQWIARVDDGSHVTAGDVIATLAGPARSMLSAERILLNFIGRLSGVATLTRRFVDAVSGTKARIYDTRKTTPGWRRLEKYAVRCGGGCNHRAGLYDAILIKDNHLAMAASGTGQPALTPREAVERARAFAESHAREQGAREMIVEVEVDTLAQLEQVLPVGPDIVLLDNMSHEMLRQAVAIRDQLAPQVELEASGGVNQQSVAAIAATGIDRISAGALTHSAVAFDVALDWK